MRFAWFLVLGVLWVHVLAASPLFAEVCDVEEGMGFFHWPEKVAGEGTLAIEPDAPVVAGASATWTITYTAGPNGLPGGAAVELVTPRGCTPARIGDESVSSVVLASIDGEALQLRSVRKEGRRFPGSRVAALIPPQGLPAGGKVVLTWKNASVSRMINSLDDTFLEFYLLERKSRDAEAVLLPNMVRIRLLPGQAEALDVFVSSIASVGSPARVTVHARDSFGNPAIGYTGTVVVSASAEVALEPISYTFTEDDRGAHTFEDVFFRSPGVAYLTVEDAANHMEASSNPVEVLAEEPDLNLYWADIHVHTVMSWDAWFGAQSVVSYAGAYRMGREFAGLDFQANTDHDAPNPYGEKEWAEMTATANDFNEPGRFATLVAIENSGPTGDKNVYWRGDSAPYIVAEAKKDPIALFHKLEGEECLIIPHHVAQDMRPTDWRPSFFHPEKERLLEIFSNHGRAEFYGNIPHFSSHAIATMKGYTYQDALARGYRMGVVAASDDHRGRVGTVGLTGVWAEEQTRESIYDAMKARRCYGTTNPRIILRFSADGHQMGEEFSSAGPVRIVGSAIGSYRLFSIEVIKNGETVHVAYPENVMPWDTSPRSRRIYFEWTDEDFDSDSYYYLRVTQAPDPAGEEQWGMPPLMDFAWSSPVWVTHEDSDGKQPEAAPRP